MANFARFLKSAVLANAERIYFANIDNDSDSSIAESPSRENTRRIVKLRFFLIMRYYTYPQAREVERVEMKRSDRRPAVQPDSAESASPSSSDHSDRTCQAGTSCLLIIGLYPHDDSFCSLR